MIYIITLVFLLIPVVRFDLMQLEGNKRMWALSEYVVLVLIVGLRYRVGGDTLFYMDFFEDYPTISELANFDFEDARYNPLWYVYNSIFKTFGNSFTIYQLVQATIVNLAFFRFLDVILLLLSSLVSWCIILDIIVISIWKYREKYYASVYSLRLIRF